MPGIQPPKTPQRQLAPDEEPQTPTKTETTNHQRREQHQYYSTRGRQSTDTPKSPR